MNRCPQCNMVLHLSTGNPNLVCVNRKCNFIGEPVKSNPLFYLFVLILVFVIFITFLYDVGILWQN